MLQVTSKIVEKDSGWDKLSWELENLSSKIVRTGVQASEDSEILKIANANEFGADIDHPGGTPYVIGKGGKAVFVKKGTQNVAGVTKPHKINIPARPFIRQTFDKHSEELAKIGFDLGRLILEDKMVLKSALEIWGDNFISFVRSEVADGVNFEPNKPATIRKKGGGKHPLQDSGRLMNALKAVVE